MSVNNKSNENNSKSLLGSIKRIKQKFSELRQSIQFFIFGFVILMTIGVLLFVNLFYVYRMKASLEESFYTNCSILTQSLTSNIREGVLIESVDSIDSLFKTLLENDTVVYASVSKYDNGVVKFTRTTKDDKHNSIAKFDEVKDMFKSKADVFDGESVETNNKKPIGFVEIYFSKDLINQKIRTLLIVSLIIASIVSLVIAFIMAFVVSRKIVSPVIRVSNKLSEISEAVVVDFEKKLTVDTKDEIGDLVTSFNKIQDKVRDQVHLINEKSKDLEEKNQEILDSILYAKTIQLSILPQEELIKSSAVEDYFIIWKPRDIVGGDIYWFGKFEDNFIFAVIDCTGHGVPGAFMTMNANAVFNRVSGEVCHDDPAKMLKEINLWMRRTLNHDKENESLKDYDDGFDCAICLVKPNEQKLIYAGAKIPLFICKDGSIEIIKGDKQGIGYKRSSENFEYTNHEIQYSENETFYLTTDGYCDQMGGAKKFGIGKEKFKQTILSNNKNSLNEQKVELENLLKRYKGDNEQTDDITVVGFKPKCLLSQILKSESNNKIGISGT